MIRAGSVPAQIARAGVLLAFIATAASAQSPMNVRFSVGMLLPTYPLVLVEPGQGASVNLVSAPMINTELQYPLREPLSAFFAASWSPAHITDSEVLEMQEPHRPLYSAAVGTITVGGAYRRGVLRDMEAAARLGGGFKLYRFDLEGSPGLVRDLTLDVGGSLALRRALPRVEIEVRYLPSFFDPRFLPIRATGDERQLQNDFHVLLGYRATFGKKPAG